MRRTDPYGALIRLEEFLTAQRWTEAEALARRQLALGARDPENHAAAVIAMARIALGRGRRDEMHRWLDRAGRIMTNDERFREFQASLLLSAGDAAAALTVLATRPENAPPRSLAESVALALARWQNGQQAEACALVQDLLHRHLVTPNCALSGLAGVIAAAQQRPGWVGHGGGGLLIGALRFDLPAEAEVILRPASDGAAPFIATSVSRFIDQYHADRSTSATTAFTVLLDSAASGPLSFEIEGQPLLGSALPLSQALVIEGVAEIEGSRVSGWVSCFDLPDFPLELRLIDGAGRWVCPPVDLRNQHGEWRRTFSFDLTDKDLAPGLIEVTAGPQHHPLAGSPVRWVDCGTKLHPAIAPESRQRTVDVIVPVYGGREDTLACLDRLRVTLRGTGATLVVVDDATPDLLLSAALDHLNESGRFTLLRNSTNLGFPASANLGMALHPDRDVVLLNADTLVFGDWLKRLQAAAYASPDTGTVTPLSNYASICAYPTPGTLSHGETDAEIRPSAARCAAVDRVARRVNAGRRVELPTAVGFCMYIRRACLAETGDFREELFGRGYGEENDFCMRARHLGWRHYAAADVYVAHVGGQSFGRQGRLLQERNIRVLERLHPGYQALISRFHAADPLAESRRRLDLSQWHPSDPRPTTLIITLDLDGGVSAHVNERVRLLTESGHRVVAVVPAATGDHTERRRCRLIDRQRPELRDLVFDTPDEMDDLVALLRRSRVVAIEIHHSLHHDASVLTLPQRLDVPYEVVVHDYHWICPQLVLIGISARYCGEPDIESCEYCALTLGAEDGAADISVAELRRRSARLLAGAERVVAPSQDVAIRLRRYFPDLTPFVEPWDSVVPPKTAPTARKQAKVCVIGAIGPHKGYDILLACARDAAARDLPLDFVVVGYTCDDGLLFATGRVFITGRYDEAEAADLVRAQQAQIAFLPSICPETWCYALSVAWRSGLPVVAFNLGAQAERIRASGGGWTLPTGMQADEINNTLMDILQQSVVDICHEKCFSDRMKDRLMLPSSASVASQISATTQAVSLPPGFYAVTVRRGGQPAAPGRLPLPAVQLVVPPDGVSPDAVEILSSHPGGWLTKVADTILLKITRDASVLLTSYKNALAGSDSLEIEVTRVDASPSAAEEAVPAAVPPKADVVAHIQLEGDQTFPAGTWAGARGTNRWVEAFGVLPIEGLTAEDIEYKGLSASGVETPWSSGGTLCGTRGQGMPLLGFAARLRGDAAEHFDCLYEGVFIGGSRSGPCRNGAPCRSDVLGAPLEGLLLSFVPKSHLVQRL